MAKILASNEIAIMTESLRTPLHSLHLAANAKMVDFGGFDMPVSYPLGIMKEHLPCRSQAGLFDVSHMGQVLIQGQQARQDLEALLPVDLDNLLPGQQVYTVMLNAEGGIVDDMIVTCWSDTSYFIVLNAGCKAKDIAHIEQHLSVGTKLTLLSDRALLALQGPKAIEVLARLSNDVSALVFMTGCHTTLNDADCFVTRSGYTGEDGFEISVSESQAEALAQCLLAEDEVEWIGLGARDSLRLEAGLCLYGHDMDEAIAPGQATLMGSIAKARRVDGAKEGGFVGAEQLFALQANGTIDKRVGFIVEGKAPVREGAEVVNADNEVIGRISSGGFAPTLGAPIAMGYISKELSSVDTQVFALVRGKPRPIRVAKTPFVTQNYFRG